MFLHFTYKKWDCEIMILNCIHAFSTKYIVNCSCHHFLMPLHEDERHSVPS
jgi:hypothetical protein